MSGLYLLLLLPALCLVGDWLGKRLADMADEYRAHEQWRHDKRWARAHKIIK